MIFDKYCYIFYLQIYKSRFLTKPGPRRRNRGWVIITKLLNIYRAHIS